MVHAEYRTKLAQVTTVREGQCDSVTLREIQSLNPKTSAWSASEFRFDDNILSSLCPLKDCMSHLAWLDDIILAPLPPAKNMGVRDAL